MSAIEGGAAASAGSSIPRPGNAAEGIRGVAEGAGRFPALGTYQGKPPVWRRYSPFGQWGRKGSWPLLGAERRG